MNNIHEVVKSIVSLNIYYVYTKYDEGNYKYLRASPELWIQITDELSWVVSDAEELERLENMYNNFFLE